MRSLLLSFWSFSLRYSAQNSAWCDTDGDLGSEILPVPALPLQKKMEWLRSRTTDSSLFWCHNKGKKYVALDGAIQYASMAQWYFYYFLKYLELYGVITESSLATWLSLFAFTKITGKVARYKPSAWGPALAWENLKTLGSLASDWPISGHWQQFGEWMIR